jgi:hypothetical protein
MIERNYFFTFLYGTKFCQFTVTHKSWFADGTKVWSLALAKAKEVAGDVTTECRVFKRIY